MPTLILGLIEWLIVIAIPYGLDWACMKLLYIMPFTEHND